MRFGDWSLGSELHGASMMRSTGRPGIPTDNARAGITWRSSDDDGRIAVAMRDGRGGRGSEEAR